MISMPVASRQVSFNDRWMMVYGAYTETSLCFCPPGVCPHEPGEEPPVRLVGLRAGREDDAAVKAPQQNHHRGRQPVLGERGAGPEAGRQAG